MTLFVTHPVSSFVVSEANLYFIHNYYLAILCTMWMYYFYKLSMSTQNNYLLVPLIYLNIDLNTVFQMVETTKCLPNIHHALSYSDIFKV